MEGLRLLSLVWSDRILENADNGEGVSLGTQTGVVSMVDIRNKAKKKIRSGGPQSECRRK